MSNTTKITLAVSIILNILLIGILLGAFSHRVAGPLAMHRQMEEAIGGLPEAKQNLVRDTLKQLRSETNETRKKVKRKRDELLETITAPEFDEQIFDRKAAELHALMGELAGEIADAAKKIAARLDQDERKELAEIIRMRHGRRHFHGGGWDCEENGKGVSETGASENGNSAQ